MYELFSLLQKLNILPADKSYCIFSVLQEFSHTDQSEHIGIKYANQGLEIYKIGDQSYDVTKGQYLLLNNSRNAKVEVDSKIAVKGFCIIMQSKLIQEASIFVFTTMTISR